ncbi:MAG: hypothetical protein ACJ0NC_03360 [Candidatus Marivariicella sp.]|jgi:hypothetical protein|tara:strand:- start:10366 stop:11028 length:663 start_codon:yes stop_codon:yes gene_type:complete
MIINNLLTTNIQEALNSEKKINLFQKNWISQEKNYFNEFNLNKLKNENIFHINTIKSTCVDYRLRFLDIKYFKGEIPLEAIEKIKQMEIDHNKKLNSFKIMAPSIMFRLKKTDDPLLFIPIGSNYFYLIHKWGNDLAPLRKIRMWPFRSITNLLLTLLFLSYFVTLITPISIFTKNPNSSGFWILFLFMFKALVSIVLFLGVALGKNFNPKIWNSKYNKS